MSTGNPQNLSVQHQPPSLPQKYEQVLAKRKKWPLKGWHRRYFVFYKGVLEYGRNKNTVTTGRLHGRIELHTCIMVVKQKKRIISMDSGKTVFHIKAKDEKIFKDCVLAVRQHIEYARYKKKQSLIKDGGLGSLSKSPSHNNSLNLNALNAANGNHINTIQLNGVAPAHGGTLGVPGNEVNINGSVSVGRDFASPQAFRSGFGRPGAAGTAFGLVDARANANLASDQVRNIDDLVQNSLKRMVWGWFFSSFLGPLVMCQSL